MFSTGYTTNDIEVYTQTNGATIPQGGVRGRAGFSSRGEPYKRVMIIGGANRNGDDQLLEGLLGYCFGLRHTDWNTRNSCNQSGESVNPEVAIYIPDTPGASQDSSSITNSCFPYNNREFGRYNK